MGFDLVNGLAGRSMVLDGVMLFAAGPLIYMLFAACGLLVLLAMRDRDRIGNLWLLGQVGGSLMVAFVIGRVIRMIGVHERPFQSREVTQLVDHDPGVSFPSNHATAALAVALVIWVFVSVRWGVVLMVPAVVVAFSRVYVGVHWPSDIISAAVVVGFSVAAVWWAARLLRRRLEPEPDLEAEQPHYWVDDRAAADYGPAERGWPGYGDHEYDRRGYREEYQHHRAYQHQDYADQDYADQGYGNRGYPARGYPERGYPERGYPDQGYEQDTVMLPAVSEETAVIPRVRPGAQGGQAREVSGPGGGYSPGGYGPQRRPPRPPRRRPDERPRRDSW
ncbi:phosphatase PAP2 family protein [Natronosporangium hydrolyticum]|uniref:Phosphatase PAP2 family protein n=1 Tax=Natronosporangium hydrolyticum TaxID=2811111 RepID=A0A895YKG1_9ACTN|nr:phosphatase PAP2 family protein [Natronosporangium hydrolyticum]QSB15126.1 phosphatase PAP2 family protein [Natronosporangium hydrolyticum]